VIQVRNYKLRRRRGKEQDKRKKRSSSCSVISLLTLAQSSYNSELFGSTCLWSTSTEIWCKLTPLDGRPFLVPYASRHVTLCPVEICYVVCTSDGIRLSRPIRSHPPTRNRYVTFDGPRRPATFVFTNLKSRPTSCPQLDV
jgi:hypothetical protein